MGLSNKEAKELIRSPKSSVHLSRARYQESRLKFHAQVAEQWTYASNYKNDFKLWYESIITATDKRNQFEKLLTYPLKSNEVVDSIADEYSKVFHAQNAFIGVDFTDTQLEQDYAEYSKGYESFWRKDVFSAMLTAINSIVVIDMPEEVTDVPKPYYYLLSIDQVIDIDCEEDGTIEHIIFKDCDGRYIVIDDERYHVYTLVGNDLRLKSSNDHLLGYCPCAFMWSDSLSANNPYVKQSPISAILSDLDWYLFHVTAKRCLDIYAAYPIYWSFKDKCSISECNGGFIRYELASNTNEYGYKRCPSCEKNSIVAPGSHIGIDPPRGSDSPNLRDPAGIISIDESSLKFNVGETERLKEEIIKTATGKLTEKSRTTGAMNEDQVHSNYESQTNILLWIAGNFEKIHKFVIDTTAKIMYGDRYIGCTVSYGTDFYLQDLDSVTAEYKTTVEAGLPMYILQAKRNQIDELQSKNNPNERQRLYILRQLEPYQDIAFSELQGLSGVDPIKFAIKLNFATFVNQFELEYGNIVEWGSKLEMKTKIERINQVFKTYVEESNATS